MHRLGRVLLQDAGEGGAPAPSGIAGWSRRVHGYTATISLGVVMPLAAIIARSFRVSGEINAACPSHVSWTGAAAAASPQRESIVKWQRAVSFSLM